MAGPTDAAPPRIDLLLLGGEAVPAWRHGAVVVVAEPTPSALHEIVTRHLEQARPDALLHWDATLGPPPDDVARLLEEPDDVWHAGLLLGTTGLPSWIDVVDPTWMLNADPSSHLPATSWRVTLRACLTRTEVVVDLGHVDPTFEGLDAAALELGHRWITGGALCRHEPSMLSDPPAPPRIDLTPADEQRFVDRRYGRWWAAYATLRGPAPLRGLLRLRRLPRSSATARALPRPLGPPVDQPPTVTVVIPTLDRYRYLRHVVADLLTQTVRPDQVVVVDQTPIARRQDVTPPAGGDLRLVVLHLDRAGQCTARNRALDEAEGELVLFVDDDDELPSDLLERHLRRVCGLGVDGSSGVAREPGERVLPPGFRHFRQSDVLPTNNTLVWRDRVEKAGRFDPAFDRGERADHDLGMRLHLSGARIVLDPDVEAFHHHAPSGGLRSHGARVTTYRQSRNSLTVRHHLAATELYLWKKYYRPDQVREAVRLRVLGTFSRRGTTTERLARIVTQIVLLPDTLWRTHRAQRSARLLIQRASAAPPVP